jgi:SAM-dependent methyltransferase
MRGWVEPYRISVGLGVRQLARRRHVREAVIRVVVPMDPSRYLELPWAIRALSPAPGESVLDLASPKLLCVALARRGARVTSVDQLPDEIEKWKSLARDEPNLELRVADGRALPFADESFDHGSSISVLEHVGGDRGDVTALSELARCVRSGGRIAITLPYARSAWVEYRSSSAYVDEGERSTTGGAFFQRWYDDADLERLVGDVPAVRVARRDVVRLAPNLNALYTRTFPALVPLGPFYGLLARERRAEDGDVVRLLLERR